MGQQEHLTGQMVLMGAGFAVFGIVVMRAIARIWGEEAPQRFAAGAVFFCLLIAGELIASHVAPDGGGLAFGLTYLAILIPGVIMSNVM